MDALKQESERVLNEWQSKLQKVARDIANPRALCSHDLGNSIPDHFDFNGHKAKLSMILVNFIVT